MSLQTLQEASDKIESLIKVVSDTDILDTDDIENYYRSQDKIVNGSNIDKAWEALALKGKVQDVLEKAYTLGLQKWVEMVENILDRHANWQPTEGFGSEEEKGYQKGLIAEAKLIRTEILTSINNLKEELK